LNKEIPHSAGFVDIDLDEVSGFSPTKFTPSSGIFTDERLLDN
jgi:hypothetical protein